MKTNKVPMIKNKVPMIKNKANRVHQSNRILVNKIKSSQSRKRIIPHNNCRDTFLMNLIFPITKRKKNQPYILKAYYQ